MRRGLLLVAVPALLWAPAGASAHVPTSVRIASPGEDARVEGGSVRIVLVGEGGSATATFGLTLDQQPVDASGSVGGLFTTLGVRTGQQLVLDVPVALGPHELVLTPNRDTDSAAPVQRRRFRVVAAEPGGGGGPLALLAVVVVVFVAGVVAGVRRRAAARV